MPRERTTLTDQRGRKITVTTLSVTDQYKLRAAIEPGLKSDDTAQALAQAAASVADIDGVPVPFPRTPAMLEQNMDLLDDDGWVVVLGHLKAKIDEAQAAVKAMSGAGPLVPSETSTEPPASGMPSIS